MQFWISRIFAVYQRISTPSATADPTRRLLILQVFVVPDLIAGNHLSSQNMIGATRIVSTLNLELEEER